ncbi:MAG: histidine phosphatase family protein [Planctomycetota bacterium]
MITKTARSARVLLVRPGATDFDDQGRIKGSLDMPMSERGQQQVRSLAEEIAEIPLKTIYTSPCESARQTATQLAESRSGRGRSVAVKVIDCFRNIDHGLWHGKLIDEVRRNHPRVYRQGQDCPTDFCPPNGESIREAKARVEKAVRKVVRKSGDDCVAIVIPDPMAWVVESLLTGEELSNLWKAETDSGRWDLIQTGADRNW